MSPAYLAAKAAERRRTEQSAEFARQLPLYQAEMTAPPPGYLDEGEGRRFDCRQAPDWTTNY